MAIINTRLNDQLPPMVDGPAPAMVDSNRYAHHSIETLVVVLAVITIVGVIAGIIARVCGGRHFGANGEHDIEGWVERKCRSCIDGGVPPASAAEESKPTAEQEKK